MKNSKFPQISLEKANHSLSVPDLLGSIQLETELTVGPIKPETAFPTPCIPPETVLSPFTIFLFVMVVIAIIAILAAMLLPALSKARERARNSNCVNNLKHLGTGAFMYAERYKDRLPYVGGWDSDPQPIAYTGSNYSPWWHVLNEYVANDKSFVCPADTNKNCDNDLTSSALRNYPGFSDGLSYGINGKGGVTYMVLSKAYKPSATVMIGDTGSSVAAGDAAFITSLAPTTSEAKQKVSIRHGNGCNIVMADGHVMAIRATATNAAETEFDNLNTSAGIQLLWEGKGGAGTGL